MRLFVVLLFVMTLGCNGVKTEAVVPASGTITFQGKPLEGYRITVVPNGDKQSASAVSEAEGKFSLGCNVPGDGAPPGSHKVTVVFVSEVAEGEPGKEVFKTVTPKVKIPKKYEDIATTDLTLEIPPAGSTDLKLELK